MVRKTGKDRVAEQLDEAKKRRAGVLAMQRAGATMQAIGDAFGVSRSRAHEMLKAAIEDERNLTQGK